MGLLGEREEEQTLRTGNKKADRKRALLSRDMRYSAAEAASRSSY
jgi:hypothetical protein